MKKLRLLSLVSLSLLLAGCSGGNSSEPSSTTPDSSVTDTSSADSSIADSSVIDDSGSGDSSVSYPDVTLRASATEDEVEIGLTVEVRAILATSATDKTCTFTSSDTSIATVEIQENGVRGTVTGVAEGQVTITITSNANPTVTASVTLTVIATKPALRQAVQNVQQLDNYTLTIEKDGDVEAYMYVTDDAILYEDPFANAVFEDESGKNMFGELVTADGDVIYVKANGLNFITTSAEVVQSNAGLLTKDNFKGLKDQTKQAFEVGTFYTFDAINPSWVTDVKAEDNEYLISGEAIDDTTGIATDITAAYLECQLWNLADPEGYAAAVNTLNEDYYWSLASQVETYITVESTSKISATVINEDDEVFTIEMSNVGTTTLASDDNDIETLFASTTAASPVIAENLEKAITAIKTDNYVRVNSMFPDHSTEITFNTYFTPSYVFYDCNANFVNEYNTHLSDDTEAWTDIPYGYVKKADGVYKFTYDETAGTVTVATTKEANTDSTTTVAEYDEYFSTISTFSDTSTLKYSFATTAEAIWNNHTTKYYTSTSRTVFDEFINNYAPEDIEDVVENTKAGIGVDFDSDGNVSNVYGTLGFTPFVGNGNTMSTHTYGVDYFELNSFGSATTNKVNSLLASHINA